MIQLLSTNTDFTKALADYLDDLPSFFSSYPFDSPTPFRWTASMLRAGLLSASPHPWIILSEAELAPMLALPRPDGRINESHVIPDDPNFIDRIKWRFSAASVAIRFLEALPETTRPAIRDIVLHEDRQSVSDPECHMLGLLPYCLENTKLHIERRVNIWRNICASQIGCNRKVHEDVGGLEYLSTDDSAYASHDESEAHYVVETMAAWLTEASALPARGMPAGSFSLVLDSEPSLDSSSEFFETIKEAAA